MQEGRVGGETLARELLSSLASEDHPSRRRDLLRRLGWTRSDSAVAYLTEAVAQPESWTEREYASVILALGGSGRPEAALPLVRLVVSDDRARAKLASTALGMLIADGAEARAGVGQAGCELMGQREGLERRGVERVLWSVVREEGVESLFCRSPEAVEAAPAASTSATRR